MILGLDALEEGGKVNDLRLAALMESTQAIVDIIGRHVAPQDMERVPELTRARMEKYHAKI